MGTTLGMEEEEDLKKMEESRRAHEEARRVQSRVQSLSPGGIEREKRATEARSQRELDFASGQKRAESLLPKESLGRLQGFNAKSIQAAREQRINELDSFNQLQNRDLRGQLARSGVRGGVAIGAQQAVASQQLRDRARAEQSLYLEQQKAQQGIDTFNLGQLGKEKKGQISIQLGEVGAGLAERGAISQEMAAEASAAATRAASDGGKKDK